MIPVGSRICETGGMRKGVEVRLGLGDRERLEVVIGSGNSPQKPVWRARIVLLSADGVGTMAIQRQTGKGKPTIWRWQARFMAEGVEGLQAASGAHLQAVERPEVCRQSPRCRRPLCRSARARAG